MLEKEKTEVMSILELAVEKVRDLNHSFMSSVKGMREKNEKLHDEVTELKERIRTLENDLSVSVSTGRVAQTNLKLAEERLEEYETIRNATQANQTRQS